MYASSFSGWNNDLEAELEKTSEEFTGSKWLAIVNSKLFRDLNTQKQNKTKKTPKTEEFLLKVLGGDKSPFFTNDSYTLYPEKPELNEPRSMYKRNREAINLTLEEVSNDVDEKWFHEFKVICFWSVTDFPAVPPQSTEGSLWFWQVLLTLPVTFRSPAHRQGSGAGVTQSIIGDLWPRKSWRAAVGRQPRPAVNIALGHFGGKKIPGRWHLRTSTADPVLV